MIELDVDLVGPDRAADVVAVVNASPSISGRFPNLGPELLAASGITLIDDVGVERYSSCFSSAIFHWRAVPSSPLVKARALK